MHEFQIFQFVSCVVHFCLINFWGTGYDYFLCVMDYRRQGKRETSFEKLIKDLIMGSNKFLLNFNFSFSLLYNRLFCLFWKLPYMLNLFWYFCSTSLLSQLNVLQVRIVWKIYVIINYKPHVPPLVWQFCVTTCVTLFRTLFLQ